jgi:anion-transporting  ArsA/GET3 family ATPase
LSLADRRIIVVTGKGGVGKSTVCAALGLHLASLGRRVLITETAGCTRMPALFGKASAGYEAMELHPGLHTLSITSEKAIEDHVVQQIRFKRLYHLVFRNRVMGPFVDAVPGLHDLVQMGKVMDEERATLPDGRPRWDHILVDAPATGHGLNMLASPANMMALTRSGPLHDGALQVQRVIADPAITGIILVCLPEAMPVQETLELHDRLGPLAPQVGALILNEVHPPCPSSSAEIAAARPHGDHDPDLAEALGLAAAWAARGQQEDRARAALGALPIPRLELPFLHHRDLGPRELATLGEALGPPLAAHTNGNGP